VAIDKGVIRQQVGERDRMTYVVRNDNGESRDVVIEHRARDKGWTTDASVPAAEVTDEWIRYRITVGPQASASFTVDNSRSVETALTIETITDSQVALYVQDRLLTPALEAALREVLGRKERLAAVDASLASRRSEIEIIGRDQSRLRENMRALKGSSEERRLLQRYVAELDEQETRLAVLQGELAALDAERQRLQGDLARYIAGLSMS
jgi:septal ring factor EnvC (AmiA/AmiB activator)